MVTYSNIFITEGENITEPVDVADVKAWLRIDFSDDDTLLQKMIVGARETIEDYLHLALVEKTVEVDAVCTSCTQWMHLPYAQKVVNDETFVVSDNDNDDEVLTATEYHVRGGMWKVDYAGNYKIAYTVDPVINEAIREAIKMEVAERYHNRGELDRGLSEAAKAKVKPYRQIWL